LKQLILSGMINKIWAYGEKNQKLEVYAMDPNPKGDDKKQGVWNIAGVPMIVSKWSPKEDDSEAKVIPL